MSTTNDQKTIDPKQVKALLMLQSVVRAFIATKRAKQRVKRFIFRTKVVMEIEATESNYLRDLQLAMNEFYEPMSKILTEQEMRSIFINIKDLIELHQELLEAFKAAKADWEFRSCFASAFIPLLPKFKRYQVFIDNYANAAVVLKEKIAESKQLDEMMKQQSRKSRNLHLEDILIMPVQRLPRYQLLLKELAKHTEPGHADEKYIKEATEGIQEVLSFLNESRKKVDRLERIQNMMQSVTDLEQSLVIERSFIYEGPLILINANLLFGKKDTSRPNTPRGESQEKKDPQQQAGGEKSVEEKKKEGAVSLWNLIGKEEVYVYLFEDMMLSAKKIKKTTDPRYLFLNKVMAYKYNVLDIVPLFGEQCATPVKDQECSFRVDTDSTHIYIAQSGQMRDIWVNKINNRTKKV